LDNINITHKVYNVKRSAITSHDFWYDNQCKIWYDNQRK